MQDSPKAIMVTPLVMYRQTLREGKERYASSTMSSHSVEMHRKAFIASSGVFSGPVGQAEEEQLPKNPGHVRPRSAEPVTRSTLHLSSGNYTRQDASRSNRKFRLPRFEESAQSALPPRSGIPATLVASQLMQSATPAGVHTGEDAVHYFSTNKHQSSGSLFIFCNFTSSDPLALDPYSLVVVDSSAVDAEHCVVSCTGVCHIRPNDSGNTVSPLHTWAAEARQFRTLRRLTFFKKFAMVKAWAHWKTEHQAGKFSRRARFLETNHLMLNAWFGDSMRACHRLVRAHAEQPTVLCFPEQKHRWTLLWAFQQHKGIAVQAASVKSGCTGTWLRVGSTWHVSSLSSSLKEVLEKAVPVTRGNLVSGALNLPLRLSFLGHEGCCHKLNDFQRIRTDMRDSVSAVRSNTQGEFWTSCISMCRAGGGHAPSDGRHACRETLLWRAALACAHVPATITRLSYIARPGALSTVPKLETRASWM